jgi:hypothetical protein
MIIVVEEEGKKPKRKLEEIQRSTLESHRLAGEKVG